MSEHVQRVVERARTAAVGDPNMDPTARLETLEGEVADLTARIAQLEEAATQDAVKDLTAWSGQTAGLHSNDLNFGSVTPTPVAVPSPDAAGFVEPEEVEPESVDV